MRHRVRAAARLLAPVALACCALLLTGAAGAQTPEKLLITQVEIRGNAASTTVNEYVVIRNPGSTTVDLSNYYLTDATFANGNQYYYNLPDDSLPIGGGDFNDFVAKFPDGASIAPGQEMSIAINGAGAFQAAYGQDPHFALYDDGLGSSAPVMDEARPGSVSGNPARLPSLTNTGEVIILFHWDGSSNLVTDIDYVLWGDTAEAVDKTGVTITATGNPSGSTYAQDTPLANQEFLVGDPSGTYIRTDLTEGTQIALGSNGVNGRDETSENLQSTFSDNTDGVPPGQVPVDTTPPTLVSAAGEGGAGSVAVTFSEPVATGADVAGNYEVFPTGNEAGAIAVNAAAVNGAVVTLTLGGNLESAVSYTVRVNGVQDAAGNVIVANSTVTFVSGAAEVFAVTGVFQFGRNYVGVAFSDTVNTGTATNTANYAFTPALSLAGATVQDNGRTVILRTSGDLPLSTGYSLTVTGVTGADGAPLVSGGPVTTTTASFAVSNIADIHAMTLPSLNGGDTGIPVAVIGQVFITSASGGTPSGYIQDGSGRGLNIFGNGASAITESRESVVAVQGEAGAYFTTVEIENYTATQLYDMAPPLAPRVLTPAQAADPQWEGTFIQTTDTLTGTPSASGSSNYNAVGQTITFRIRTATGINFGSFGSGDVVTGRGAGGAFQSTFQINVGHFEDFFLGSGAPDTTPPTLVGAGGEGTSTTATVTFSEAVGAGANTAGNYTVAETGNPSNTIPVTAASSASGSGALVTLTLGSALTGGTGYTVTVSNVADLAGNVIAPGSTVTFTATQPAVFEVVDVFQFGRNYVGVAFSQEVNPGTATTLGNYAFTPSLGLTGATVQDNGQTVILQTSGDLPQSTMYSLTVSGVTNGNGAALGNGGPVTTTTASFAVTNIADIHAMDLPALNSNEDGLPFGVVGQVFISTNGGGTPSGWIQDGSGRGLNIFGNGASAITESRQSVVAAQGEVGRYFSTVEMENYTATQLAAGVPALAPRVLSPSQAADSRWEGTFIQTTDVLQSPPVASGSSNYNAVGQIITYRIRTSTGIDFNSFGTGDQVTGRGAGGAFQSTFQINVGHFEDFFKGGDGGGQDSTRSGGARVNTGNRTLLRGSPEPFEITFGAVGGSNTMVRIFDMSGRLVRTLYDGPVGDLTETVVWDGRDMLFEYVPAGAYVCHVQAIAPDGKITRADAPVVVSVRLK